VNRPWAFLLGWPLLVLLYFVVRGFPGLDPDRATQAALLVPWLTVLGAALLVRGLARGVVVIAWVLLSLLFVTGVRPPWA
jgi:hypothetical protein